METKSNAEPSSVKVLDSPPSIEERRALIERVVASDQFSRSARLRDFLLYVGRKSLKESCPDIHEQEIGIKVFGRPDSYDCGADAIVRVNATELRRRIDSYFESAGVNEPLVLEIPRGGYRPVFRRRLPETTRHEASRTERLPAVSPPPAGPEAVPRNRPRFLAHVAWPLWGLSLVACAVLLQQNWALRRTALLPWQGKPVVATFWTEFLSSHQQTDIVLPDDSASVVEDITGHPNSLGDYLTRDYNWIQSSNMSADRKRDLYQILSHNMVTFGAIRAEQQIIAALPASSPRFVTFTRYYTADEIKRNNVVLIGGAKAVPWDHLFDNKINFVLDYDDAHSYTFVRNRSPKAGEQAVYHYSLEPNNTFVYSVIAYLPNPSRTGNAIILAGTDSDATAAASEFLTSEEQMERFRNKIHSDRFPYFEVLLKVSRLSGTSLNAELIAYRTYPELH